MKKSKILYLSLAILSLVVGMLAFSVSAADDTAPAIVSKNISYDNDLKFVVAVPVASVSESLTFTVTADGVPYSVTRTVAQLSADNISDPTINGVQCYAIMSDVGVALKDMAKEYTLTVTSGGKTSKALNYSVAEYLYERLFKNNIALAEEGTPDADRKALYLSTLALGADAERVLYNLNGDETDDIATFADEYIYSNITGEAKLYKSGDKVTLASSTSVYRYVKSADGWTKSQTVLPAGEVSLDAHLVLSGN